MPFVYMLRCRDGSLYTGAARDLERRLAQHQSGAASRYTRSRRPVTLAWWRRVRSWSGALRLEARVKMLGRADKMALAEGRVTCRLRTRALSESVLILIARPKSSHDP